MQQLLTPDAFRILSESYVKIGYIGVETIDLDGPAQQASINKLIECTMLYDVIMEHVVLNNAGTAVIGVQFQSVDVINDLLFQLKKAVGIYKLPILPLPLTTYEFNFANNNAKFDLLPGNLGDLIVFNGTVFTNFGKGPDGSVLTSTPLGLVWSTVAGNGLPSGGTTNQYLRKNSNTSYDVVWDTLSLAKISDVTATAAEVNILDGAIISTTELNFLDGVNAPIQTQLDARLSNTLPNGQFWVGNGSGIATPRTPGGQVTFDNAGSFSITAGAVVNSHINSAANISRSKFAAGTPNALVINSAIGVMTDAAAIAPVQVLVSDANGIPTASPVTAATLLFLDATSSVQTQLDNKLTVSLTSPAQGDILSYTGANWTNFAIGTVGQVLTSNGTSVYWGSPTANGIPAGGTTSQYLRKVDATDFNTEWHTLILSDITNVSVSASELNLLSGLTVSSTQLNQLTGINANVQTQLDNKQNRSLAVNAMWVGNGSNLASELAPGTSGDILTMVGGVPQWQTPTPPGNVSGVSPTVVNTIVRWNDTGGSSIKGSGITIDNSNNITGVANLQLNTTGAIRTSTSIGNTLLLQAYDVDGTSYTTFATLTAGNTPTMDLASPVTLGGAYIYRASGTDVALGDGGTGASLSSPGADRIMFWDQSANAVTWLQVGTNLSITGTTLNATGGGGGPTLQQREQPGTTYTIQASDNGYIIYFTDPLGCMVTIPAGLSANFEFTSARAEGAGIIDHQDDGTSILNTINGNTDIQNENTAVSWVFKGSNNWYGFGALGSSGGGGAVNSVSGTTDRISVTGPTADPIVDIASTYIGQSSITTVGTITTGTWNATTIAVNKGGTGITSLGSALQLLRVNSGGTSLEYFTAPYITGNQNISITGDASGSGTTSINLVIGTNIVSNAKFRQSAALSVVGNATNATANVDDIVAGSNYNILRRSGTAIGFGAIDLSQSGAVGTSILSQANGGTGLDSLVPVQRTGTAIQFDRPATYGYSAAQTGNISLNNTGLQEGVTQLLIHNQGTVPTFGSEFVIIGGYYIVSVVNYISMWAIKSNLILVTITQGP